MEDPMRVKPSQMLASKIEQAVRLGLLHFGSKFLPLYLITEYPKSGGTWLGQMVSDALCLTFPRNRIPVPKRSLFHGHYLPARSFGKLKKILWLVRDGRDVVVSSYFHGLIWNDRNIHNPKTVLHNRTILKFADYNDVKTNLPVYMKHMFTHVPSKVHRFTFWGNWNSFNENWLKQKLISPEKVVFVRYEDLLASPVSELTRILRATRTKVPTREEIENIVYRYSLQKLTGRKPGEENRSSFVRKGIVGDWKNYFSEEAAKLFNKYAGKTLIKMGYEPDESWIEQW